MECGNEDESESVTIPILGKSVDVDEAHDRSWGTYGESDGCDLVSGND